jgi:hypothetical protein
VKLGIGSFACAWEIGVPGYPDPEGGRLTAGGLLRRAADLGVRFVQIADNLRLHALTEEQLTDLKRLAEHRIISVMDTPELRCEKLKSYFLSRSDVATAFPFGSTARGTWSS